MNGDFEIGRRQGDELKAFLREQAGAAIAHVARVFGSLDREKAFVAYELLLSEPFDKKRASLWKEAFFNEHQRRVNAAKKAAKAA